MYIIDYYANPSLSFRCMGKSTILPSSRNPYGVFSWISILSDVPDGGRHLEYTHGIFLSAVLMPSPVIFINSNCLFRHNLYKSGSLLFDAIFIPYIDNRILFMCPNIPFT